MVRIEEVQDEAVKQRQNGSTAPFDDDKDWEATDGESDDDVSDDEVTERGVVLRDETLWDRIYALKDIISPSTRAFLGKTWHSTVAYSTMGGWVAGKLIWVGVTSALLVGLPFALAVEDEGRVFAQEKELMGQQSGQPAITEQQGDALAQGAVSPGGTVNQSLRPPGF
ncbi:mitochondrial import receptor subunit Tom22 [Malassezia vespertilionis]|uniref:Tom22p n=1 Tax=Malassezia vespertilionis TaxID=2020962 RepID=A0A2N1JDA0_9BASI|nr:mitochondrial import receptor subunit Tom22 [Malassezia vespertilionis]PKI84540.1 Tom22p [Malassezia vespertilionis]WFD06494.1 mitochondrial import receptor subunit Tom22 [Malassezia vespertilionis]